MSKLVHLLKKLLTVISRYFFLGAQTCVFDSDSLKASKMVIYFVGVTAIFEN